MQRLFRSRLFIVVLVVVALLSGLAAYSASPAGRATVLSDVMGIIVTPLQKAATGITDAAGRFLSYFTDQDKLRYENEQLQGQIRELEEQLRDFDRYQYENDRLKDYLDIKEERPDFEFEMAEVIAREPGNWFYVFTIDKGSLSGVSPRDTVITAEGLVGYILEVGTTWSKVVTIIDPLSSFGAIVSRTRDVGIVEGDVDFKEQGLCKLSDLSTDNTAMPGDTVQTSGLGDLYPRGIVIGKIRKVAPESHGISSYAVIEPAVDFSSIREVMVITGFSQTGGDTDAG